jgi:DNA-binding HxlR family transcriptional regulator
MKNCPILTLFEILGKKWVMCILYHIKTQPGITFNELKSNLGITAKGLSERLSYLEQNGFIAKKSVKNKHAFYLTSSAQKLAKALLGLEPIAKLVFQKNQAENKNQKQIGKKRSQKQKTKISGRDV